MNQGRKHDGREAAPRKSGNNVSSSREAHSDNVNSSTWAPSTEPTPAQSSHQQSQGQSPVPSRGNQPPRFLRAQTDPYHMGSMSSAVPDLAQQHIQPYATHIPHNASRPVIVSPAPGVMYQVPAGFAYPPTSPYPPSPIYSAYPQASFVHGFAPPNNTPTAYTMYPPDQIRHEILPQPTPYGHVSAPYYVYQDPFAGHAPQIHSPTRSRQSSTRSGQFGHGRSFLRHYSSGSPDRASQVSMSPDSRTSTNAGGPPRKPKQSGHAIWVGNLPPTATIVSMKEYFSRGFSREIESLFLISKSNCAFVNYRTEEACSRAIKTFHDSRFDGVRLVCRLRKANVNASTSSISAAVTSIAEKDESTQPRMMATPGDKIGDAEELVDGYSEITPEDMETPPKQSVERFFIVKSLTIQDLEQSVRNKVWATQVHNESILNEAFKTSVNVYLIFSVNKSGEYYGYARMESAIEVDAVEVLGPIKRVESAEVSGQHRTMSTTATENAPRGHITDDLSRGTIFWEADFSDDEPDEAIDPPDKEPADEQTWGKPFKIEWKSTFSVPFWRTKGIRNPWNANREVKIARDGTELETTVGERLLKLFTAMEGQ